MIAKTNKSRAEVQNASWTGKTHLLRNIVLTMKKQPTMFFRVLLICLLGWPLSSVNAQTPTEKGIQLNPTFLTTQPELLSAKAVSSSRQSKRAEQILTIGLFTAAVGGIELSRRSTPQDKAKHVLAGYLVGFATNSAYRLTFGRDKSWQARAMGVALGVIAAAIVGGAKEYYDDKTRSGTVERRDFEYTVYGGIGGAITFPVAEILFD